MKTVTKVGEDTELAWNDRHLQHAYFWLTTNQNSPYFGSPSMLFTAMGIDKRYWHDFRTAFKKGNFQRYRFEVRRSLTKQLGRVLAGMFTPIVIKRAKNNRVLKFLILPAEEPKPLPCPAFYRGSIRITTRGLQITLKRTDANMAPLHNPKGRERLLNAFGKV